MNKINIKTMLGMKFYKYIENDEFEIVRIVRLLGPEKVKITSSTGNDRKVLFSDLIKEYTGIASIGIVTFSTVKVKDNDDVIVTFTRKADIQAGISAPSVVCRQSVTDFFYSILSNDINHEQVGVSVSADTCPANINYADLLLCDSIEYSDIVNIYYDDNIDTVLKCVDILKFNDVLYNLYIRHINAIGKPILKVKDCYNGWTNKLDKLLQINNFWIDVDNILNVINVDFKLDNHIITKKDNKNKEYYSLDDVVMGFLSHNFKINVVDTIIVKYDYDIDFGEYQNENYVLLRDSDEELYLVVYMINGAYLEDDIEVIKWKEHFMDQYRLKICDKYV